MRPLLLRAVALQLSLWCIVPLSFGKTEVFQILHTNDLHAEIKTPGTPVKSTSWAKLKAKQLKRKQWAAKKNIPSLFMDAGDFSEGSFYYFAEKGKALYRLMAHMDFDAVVIGNHEWHGGGIDLLNKIEHAWGKNHNPFVLSNAQWPSEHLWRSHRLVSQFKRFGLGDHTICVMGLTTNDEHYTPYAKPVEIHDPLKRLSSLEKELKKSCSHIIALTHLGHKLDEKLIKQSEHIDMVIGGHSHIYYKKPRYIKNKKGRLISLTQVGSRAKFLGEYILEAHNKGVKIKEYQTHNLYNETDEDPKIKALSDILEKTLKEEMAERGVDVSEMVVNESICAKFPRFRAGNWGNLFAKAMMEETGSDMSFVHVNFFRGSYINSNGLSVESLFHMYPRHLKKNDDLGEPIVILELTGLVFKELLKYVVSRDEKVLYAGLSWPHTKGLTPTPIPGKRPKFFAGIGKNYLDTARVQGRGINPVKVYRIAVPSSFADGVKNRFPKIITKILFPSKRGWLTVPMAARRYFLRNKFDFEIQSLGTPKCVERMRKRRQKSHRRHKHKHHHKH